MNESRTKAGWADRLKPYERFASAFSASYMSDAKWRKALGAIADAELHLEGARWKFIDSELLHEWGVPRRADLLPTRLADGRFQPVEYRWIEWIQFPRDRRPIAGSDYSVPQDVEDLKRVLEETGRFHYREDELGLTLFGYDHRQAAAASHWP